jgi:hypothetical protein
VRVPSPALLVAVLAAAGCKPTATVERTTPVGNLQIYRTVALRVGAAPQARAHVESLEFAVASELQTRCNFEAVHVGPAAEGSKADLQLDLTIQRAIRGGDGLIQNPDMATVDVLVVLSDGVDGELVGSALIRGKSSAVRIDGNASPEQQAIEVVGTTIGDVLGKSGCRGARIARPTPDPVEGEQGDGDAGPGPEPGADEARLAEADAANEAGKARFKGGDPAGALAEFRRALGLVRDPRFAMNICLAHEALEQWSQAVAACNDVLTMNPPDALASKARARLDIIGQRRGG